MARMKMAQYENKDSYEDVKDLMEDMGLDPIQKACARYSVSVVLRGKLAMT